MRMKIRELTGDDLKLWQEDYPNRERLREEQGPALLGELKQAHELPETERNAAVARVAQKAKDQGYIAAVIKNILIEELIRAAGANRNDRGANQDVRLEVVDPKTIRTTYEIEQWGNLFRVHPDLRRSYLQEIREGTRKILVAVDEGGEPAGRVSLLYRGPMAHVDPSYKEPPDFAAQPVENDVIEKLGGTIPWAEDLYVMEGYRSSGIGPRLMLELEEVVKGLPALTQEIGLGVTPDNNRAMRVYEKLGYEYFLGDREHEQDTKYLFISHLEGLPPHEVVLMVKNLGSETSPNPQHLAE